jgi:hypothetical protein
MSPSDSQNHPFDFQNKIGVMGILNVTPDSFSDGGAFLDPEKALDRALQMQEVHAPETSKSAMFVVDSASTRFRHGV